MNNYKKTDSIIDLDFFHAKRKGQNAAANCVKTQYQYLSELIVNNGFKVDNYTFETKTNQIGQQVFVTTFATENK